MANNIYKIISEGTGIIDHYIFRIWVYFIIKRLSFLRNIHPNLIVFFNFLMVCSSFLLIILKNYYLSLIGIFIYFITYDFFDLLDGAIARYYNKTSTFGAFFDSIIDFLSEILILIGIGFYFNKINFLFYLISLILFIVFFNNKVKFDFNIKERQLNIFKLPKERLFDKIKYFLVLITRNDFRKLVLLIGLILNNFYLIVIYWIFLYILSFLNSLFFLLNNYDVEK